LRLALLGEFVRVPERLIYKSIRPGGLVASWKWDIRNHLAIQWAWVPIIRDAGFTRWQTLLLYSELGFVKNALRSLRARLSSRAQSSRGTATMAHTCSVAPGNRRKSSLPLDDARGERLR
jgi:hypothetical protein